MNQLVTEFRGSEFIREGVVCGADGAPLFHSSRPTVFANEFAPTGSTNTSQILAGDRS
jgi:hypothetical protein